MNHKFNRSLRRHKGNVSKIADNSGFFEQPDTIENRNLARLHTAEQKGLLRFLEGETSEDQDSDEA